MCSVMYEDNHRLVGGATYCKQSDAVDGQVIELVVTHLA
jgi:hypothetical protein